MYYVSVDGKQQGKGKFKKYADAYSYATFSLGLEDGEFKILED